MIDKARYPLLTFFEGSFVPVALAGKTDWVRYNHMAAVHAFGKFLHREPFLDDLTPETFEQFDKWLRRQRYAPSTVRSRKGAIHAVWKAAHADGLAVEPVRQFMRRQPWDGPQRHFYKPVKAVECAPLAADSLEAQLSLYREQRDVTDSTVKQIGYAVRRFSEFLGRPAVLADYTDSTVNQFLLAMQQQTKLSAVSIRSCRRELLTLWRMLFECELIDEPPKRVRRIKVARKIPEAWTLGELQKLMATAMAQSGRFHRLDVPRGKYWATFVVCGFFTALRLGDLLRLEFGQIEESGWLTMTQAKTGFPIRCYLPPEALAAVEAISRPKRKRVFAAFGSRTHQTRFAQIVKRAGLKGGAQKLRRTAATLAECETPGAASFLLGHRDASLARRHYIDARQVQQSTPRLPHLALSQGGDSC